MNKIKTLLFSVIVVSFAMVVVTGVEVVQARLNNPPLTVNTSDFATSAQLAAYMPLAGGVGTGTWDLGGAVFEITNASAPTLDATGEIAWNTASQSLKIFDGSDVVALAKREKCAVIPYKDPTATDEFGHIPFFDPGTLTTVALNYASGANSVGWNLDYGKPNAVTTTVFGTNRSASVSANIIKYTSFTNSTPLDGDVLQLVITSKSATIEEISVSVCWRD